MTEEIYVLLGLVMMTLGLSQAGWVAHDYLHHAVMPTVFGNELIGDFFGVSFTAHWQQSQTNVVRLPTPTPDLAYF